ncbi:uncharacterized protein LOC126689922 [Quercus robur]|uniref:uncharacterized protein LOC126689922 n=1 Tax=Quercus robur TaxID=38942 RepID=UPI002161548B|nr:uncharacterized protein LOC126689922 [Quercus robur]
MEGSGPRQTGRADSQRQDNFLNIERGKDQDNQREGSVNTSHMSKSHSKGKDHASHKQNDRKALQQEVDDLKKKLRLAQQKRTSPGSGTSSDEDNEYRQRSRTLPNETFSYEEERPRKRSHKSPSYQGLANDAMSKALDRISQSPFTRRIESAVLPQRFHQPTFAIYNGRTDLVEHVSQFNQRMAVHTRDEALMCKIFPSSLGPMAMRWFDALQPNSIDSFKQLTQAFGFRFIISTRVPRPLDSLLSLSMWEGETLKAYSDRYWEMYNEIEGNYDDVAIKQSGSTGAQAVHAVFREPLHKILEKVKYEPFFQWPNKMAGDLLNRNRNLYCAYHQEPGHTTDDCRNLKNYLDRLVREGKLRHPLHRPEGWQEPSNNETRQNTLMPPIGTINVILAAPGRTGSVPFRVMSVSSFLTEPDDRESKRARMSTTPLIGFTEEDKQGTIQPHDDALVVTLRIGGYDVKRVLVDQVSAVEVMYPDLYKGLNLKQEDLSPYDSPLVSFEGKVVIPRGMIRLPVQTDSEVVEVNFIVVDAYSPYTAIVARPWLHALGAVSLTLHQKVKYPSGGQIKEVNCEELEKVLVGSDPERFFQIGSELPPQEKSALTAFLRQNIDVFAWDPYEAPEVDPDFICHHLNVNPAITPKRQAP